jgi:hypothetical protein
VVIAEDIVSPCTEIASIPRNDYTAIIRRPKKKRKKKKKKKKKKKRTTQEPN